MNGNTVLDLAVTSLIMDSFARPSMDSQKCQRVVCGMNGGGRQKIS
jgi:hypothetical protein